MGRLTTRQEITRVEGDSRTRRMDSLVVEEPLEIRAHGTVLAVTMRTPGDDFDLVAGFLASEGAVRTASDLPTMRYCAGTDDEGRNTFNVIDVTLAADAPGIGEAVARTLLTSSSCGLCGKSSIDAVRTALPFDLHGDATTVPGRLLLDLPDRLRRAQRLFDSTGGVHAAGLFSTDGELLCLREDVGRHNAVDKVIGWALREDRLPLRGCVLQVSGRASFELAQKAAMAGIPVLAAVSAPSSLAVELAEQAGLTLVGFSRRESLNVYAGTERVC